MSFLKRFVLLFFTFLCLLPSAIKAEVWTPETLPMVHLQDSLRFVCNPDGILSKATVDSTDAILANLKWVKGIETVVVVVERIEGGDAYQFGMDLSRKYGIGDKVQRTGLIIILSTKDRKYQFLTGHGLEGTLPDGLCYNIQQTVMVPALKQGNWDKAIYESVKAVNGVILGDETLKRRFENNDEDDFILGLAVIFAFVIFVMAFRRSASEYRRTCPNCKTKKALKIVSSRRIRKGSDWYTETTYICKKCGHTIVTERKDSDNDFFGSGGAAVPPIFMSGQRHYRSGGGFGGHSGGSFGGGSFGGGGAGGDF